MKTIYIDVYFMINFTVDILALFAASRMVCIRTSIRQLVFGGVIGAMLAIAALFLESTFLNLLISSVFVFSLYRIFCKRLSIRRSVKFMISFYISSFLISGIVNFVYVNAGGLVIRAVCCLCSENGVCRILSQRI